MPSAFEVELITPERTLYEGSAERLSVPGIAGSLGILANHAPLLTELKVGEAELTELGGVRRRFYISGGFLEVNRNQVTILADSAAGEDDMELGEAERLVQEARDRLAAAGGNDPAAAAELRQAEGRLSVVRRAR
jgi:F-type H+-transporting ATPase subunit epsilon